MIDDRNKIATSQSIRRRRTSRMEEALLEIQSTLRYKVKMEEQWKRQNFSTGKQKR